MNFILFIRYLKLSILNLQEYFKTAHIKSPHPIYISKSEDLLFCELKF